MNTRFLVRHLLRLPELVVFLVILCFSSVIHAETPSLKPYPENPYYWEYQGKPVVLLGGSKDDSLFQIPDLKEHLDEMQQSGGNYIRNTMSDRPDHDFEVYPFKRLESGKYDLDEWNDEYWERFENLLKWTFDRNIIVQIEVWDRFDYSDSKSNNWILHPYNPQNNINYNHKDSTLRKTYRKHPGSNENPFFFTVPALKNNEIVLKYQQAKIDKMLSYSLDYPNVMYCMDNETASSPEWGKYWSNYIRDKATEKGVTVQTTEMWDSWDLNHPHHKETFDHPEIYSFVDVSQNNHQKGQKHWSNFQQQRARISDKKRPLNNVKIYGADGGPFGNERDALERFWRNFIGGAASSRFHRPSAGIGLSPEAKSHLLSARLLLEEFDIFRASPDSASELLKDRDPNECYLTRIPQEEYVVFFPNEGEVKLDLESDQVKYNLKWLNIENVKWSPIEPVINEKKTVTLKTPGKGYWVAYLKKSNRP